MQYLFSTILIIIFQLAQAQNDLLIPYQAVARNMNGELLANIAFPARFTIHDFFPDGESVWQEQLQVTTNGAGLFSAQLGALSPLSTVAWGEGQKFMQVELYINGSFVDMGTQQLLSAPYAFHTESISYSVSPTGDTLFLGADQFVIVPNISAANPSGNGHGGDGGGGTMGTTSGTTEHTCGTANVVRANLTYGSVLDQEGNVYKTIITGAQEWMAENLKTSIYRNGDPLLSNLNDAQWSSTNLGAWEYYNNNAALECPYGKCYNYFACTDSRQLCPNGWHIPTNSDWATLIDYYTPAAQGGTSWGNSGGGPLKSTGTTQAGTGLWNGPNSGGTNLSGFSAIPGGFVNSTGMSVGSSLYSYFWSANEVNTNNGYAYILYHDPATVTQSSSLSKRTGMSVRCIKD